MSHALRERFKRSPQAAVEESHDSADYSVHVRVAVYAAVLGTVALCVVIWRDQWRPNGEPFSVFEGISVWPTELLRLVSFFVAIFCFIAIASRFAQNRADLEKMLGPRQPADRRAAKMAQPWVDRRPTCLRRAWRGFRALLDVVLLPHQAAGEVRELWEGYVKRNGCRYRGIRITTLVLLYFGFAVSLFIIFGPPCFPGRGEWSRWIDYAMLILSVASLILLLFVVLDITRLCNWFVRHLLGSEALPWPEHVRTTQAYKRGLLPPDMDEWLSVQLIARHTAVVGRFIYYPFVVLFIIFISRHQVFDKWDWPFPLVAVMTFILLVAVYAAIVLRTSARRARREAVARLRNRLAAARSPERIERLERLVNEVETERGGAFSPFTENPVIRAVLIPSGGLGVLAVLEHVLGRV